MTRLTLAAGSLLLPSVLGVTLLASHYNGNLYTLSLTGTPGVSGNLSITSTTTGCGTTPGWLELYPEDKTLYCFDESWSGSGSMAQYSVAADGTLSLTAQVPTTGNDVHGTLYGGVDGKGFVASAQYSPSTITTYKLPFSSTSKPQQLEKFVLAAHGPNARQDVPHPHEVLLDPTGKFFLVPDLGADLVRIFSMNSTSGHLTACPAAVTGPGDGPRHGVFWQPPTNVTGKAGGLLRLYTLNELGNSVSAWTVTYDSPATDPAGCLMLNRTQTLSTYPEGTKGGPNTKAAEIRVRDNYVYASNRADESFGTQLDSLAMYRIDPTTGALGWVEWTNAHAYYPRTFAINKAGTLVAVGGQTSSNVAIIARDTTTGKLGPLVTSLQIGTVGRAGEEDGLSAVVWVE
ncbi:6-phosphogluconolactonase [Diplogelasinospora grovesii]|uniref:6-phosphogluconolactonase n=1 Tax=Diplogelasinospora grovesii TaxID=303347 RepID=A0AAN6N0H9_9PEZI|nr:6-phosphogluconolactonase [Diplogelasinospora grovesii]